MSFIDPFLQFCILLLNTSYVARGIFLANVTPRVPMGSHKKVLPICKQVGQYVLEEGETRFCTFL